MELLKRNKKEDHFFKKYQSMIVLMIFFVLVLFTFGFKFQYLLFEIKSMISQKSFSSNVQGGSIIDKPEIMPGEGMIIRDPQESLFQNYIVEFNKDTILVVGDAVVRDGSLLGMIEQINNQFAVVGNISRSKNIVKGTVQKTSEVITLEGRGDGDFLAQVPRDYEVEVGESIMWTRNQGIMIGEVIDIKFDARDVHKRVYVRSIVQNGILQKVKLFRESNPF